MKIGKIIGDVVATRKDTKLEGAKLLVVQPLDVNGKPEAGKYVVAVDTAQAGSGDRVIIVQGSSARMAEGMTDRPVDASIIGIVDSFDIH